MRATATGPLQGPGNTPLLVYASSVLCCPIPLFLGAPLPIFFSTLEVAQPQELSSGWVLPPVSYKISTLGKGTMWLQTGVTGQPPL